MDPHQTKPGTGSAAEGHSPPAGRSPGPIPRGIEVLVKKAAVDPSFKQILLEKRSLAADEIGLKLEPAEVAMLNAVPVEQLETIIASTKVSEFTRAAFLGRAAAVMLAALGVSTQGCSEPEPVKGTRPRPSSESVRSEPLPKKEGAESNLPPGSRSNVPPMPQPPERPREVYLTDGIRPDRPAPKEDPSQAQPKPLERPTEVRPTDGISPDRP